MSAAPSIPKNFVTEALLSRHTLAIVMGGGAGTRLFPLTKDRAKPAVGSSRVDLQACKLEYSIVSPK